MYFEDIPYFKTFSEVKNRVTEIVLAASDSAEFLSGEGYGLEDIYDLNGTKYENIIPAFVSCKSGVSWGMWGMLFRFNLTDTCRLYPSDASDDLTRVD
ncbi:MAG: hypothetical protein K2I29_03485, partial [Clostridia bacterium]|nr:hypothetical protein [Clostridia bacterium]